MGDHSQFLGPWLAVAWMGGLGWWVAGVATGGWAGGRTVGRTGKRTMTQVSDAMDSYVFLWIPMDSYGFLRIPWIPSDSYAFILRVRKSTWTAGGVVGQRLGN